MLILEVLRIVLLLEAIVLCGRYIETHTEERIYEREVVTNMSEEGAVYGIGYEAEKGELFWFRKRTEISE